MFLPNCSFKNDSLKGEIITSYRLELVNSQTKLSALAANLKMIPIIALDIETVDWWDKYRERIALVQIAYRTAEQGIKVAVIDALAKLDLEMLRSVLESPGTIKIIHNAAFDAGKLFKHYKFKVAPIHDTMAAARRAGEKKYSLAAQVSMHLNINLDKSSQRSDWSRRPLDLKQIDYAARDAYATFLLYEHQQKRELIGNYRLKYDSSDAVQGVFDLTAPEMQRPSTQFALPKPPVTIQAIEKISIERNWLALEEQAILDIIAKFPDRYIPAKLAVSVGLGRVGLAGWIVDNVLGRETDFDEDTAQLVIAELIDLKLIKLNEFQKLETTKV